MAHEIRHKRTAMSEGRETATRKASARTDDTHVAVLPSGGDDELPAEVRRKAIEEMSKALKARGMKVVGADEAQQLLGQGELSECRRTDCADDVAKELGVDLVAGVAVWSQSDGEGPGSVAISLVTPEGVSYPGQAPVEDGQVAAATQVALAAAQQKRRLGPGPWIHVRGSPPGALVVIDGTAVGDLPHRGAIPPGRHKLKVRLTGYETVEKSIDVPVSNHEEVLVEVELEEKEGADAGGDGGGADPTTSDGTGGSVGGQGSGGGGGTTRTEPSMWNYVIGGGAAAAGVALLIDPLITAARNGDCVNPAEGGGCQIHDGEIERYNFGVRSGALTAVGAAVLGVSAYFFIGQPLEVQVEAGPNRAVLRIGGQF